MKDAGYIYRYTYTMKVRSKNRRGVIGIDEVGRGPLAGPVTLCAVYMEDEKIIKRQIFNDIIRDSKKLRKSLRGKIYQTVRHKRYSNTRLEYAIASRSAAYIDRHGISKAVKQCLLSCMRNLEAKGIKIEEIDIHLDAGLVIPLETVKQSSFIKGDERFTEIALASIMAKVTRDAYMNRLSKQHKEYSWERNVGYGTKEHRASIEKIGVTRYHRKTYLKAFKLFDKLE